MVVVCFFWSKKCFSFQIGCYELSFVKYSGNSSSIVGCFFAQALALSKYEFILNSEHNPEMTEKEN